MSARKIRLDDLLGRVVRDQDGRTIGRIFDMRGEERGGELVIVEYYVGAHALAQRIGLSLLGLIGVHRSEPRRIPWDRLDISDPDHPTLITA